jgi:protein O-mannosyl-transferase
MCSPLTVISFRLVLTLYGFSNVAHHAVDIVLHAIVSVLVYYVGNRAFSFSVARSTLAAVIFAIHPVHTEGIDECWCASVQAIDRSIDAGQLV